MRMWSSRKSNKDETKCSYLLHIVFYWRFGAVAHYPAFSGQQTALLPLFSALGHYLVTIPLFPPSLHSQDLSGLQLKFELYVSHAGYSSSLLISQRGKWALVKVRTVLTPRLHPWLRFSQMVTPNKAWKPKPNQSKLSTESSSAVCHHQHQHHGPCSHHTDHSFNPPLAPLSPCSHVQDDFIYSMRSFRGRIKRT